MMTGNMITTSKCIKDLDFRNMRYQPNYISTNDELND